MSCTHPNPIHTKRGAAIWKQCTECWQPVGSAIKRSTFTPEQIHVMPLFDENAREETAERDFAERKTQIEQQRKQESDAWWQSYTAYLKSPQWARKRVLVLRRDGGLCQACLESPATDVHHKTYEHVFDEPLFDLESVCRPCHELLHKKPILR